MNSDGEKLTLFPAGYAGRYTNKRKEKNYDSFNPLNRFQAR